jgi:hypothetical protein
VVAAVAESDGPAAARLADAVGVFALRALAVPRLAYAMMAEPAEPEVDAQRLVYHRAFADVFEALIEDGIRRGEFPTQQNARTAAACVMGALNQGLVGPLAPDVRPQKGDPDTATLVEAIVAFCLQAVAARPWSSDPAPRLRAVKE